MDFYFSHDGGTFYLHTTDCGEVACYAVQPPPPPPPLEPSGDEE